MHTRVFRLVVVLSAAFAALVIVSGCRGNDSVGGSSSGHDHSSHR